jgi:hypothetical protein
VVHQGAAPQGEQQQQQQQQQCLARGMDSAVAVTRVLFSVPAAAYSSKYALIFLPSSDNSLCPCMSAATAAAAAAAALPAAAGSDGGPLQQPVCDCLCHARQHTPAAAA